MKGDYHLKFTQYLKLLTLNKGRGCIFGKSRGAMAPSPPHSAYERSIFHAKNMVPRSIMSPSKYDNTW